MHRIGDVAKGVAFGSTLKLEGIDLLEKPFPFPKCFADHEIVVFGARRNGDSEETRSGWPVRQACRSQNAEARSPDIARWENGHTSSAPREPRQDLCFGLPVRAHHAAHLARAEANKERAASRRAAPFDVRTATLFLDDRKAPLNRKHGADCSDDARVSGSSHRSHPFTKKASFFLLASPEPLSGLTIGGEQEEGGHRLSGLKSEI